MSALAVSHRPRNLRLIGGARYTARADWDAIATRGFHRHAWFVAAESGGAEARHVGVFEGSELVGVIPAYIEREAARGDPHAHWFGAGHALAASLGARLHPALTLGPPMSTGSDPLGSDLVLTDAVIEEALELLESEARAEGAKAIVWPFVDEAATVIREVAQRRGFRESFANAAGVIDVEWSSPEEYIGSRSRNVQRTLRNELAWVHDQGIRVSWESDISAYASTFDAFYRASYVARNRRVSAFAPGFFAELAAQRSRGVQVQCAWKGASLLEMAVALDAGDALDMCMSAQSEDARNGLLYQHCLCYDPVRVAIERGLTKIHLGPGALQSKLLRGARLVSRYTLARGLTPAARAAIGVLSPLTSARNRSAHRRAVGTLSQL